jgi:KDO2-lipid IV(A) lauroyltransferase
MSGESYWSTRGLSIKFALILEDCMGKKRHKKRTLRRPLETGGFLIIKSIIPLLPRSMVTGLARAAGHLALALPLREKTIGMKNIDAVFGDSKSPAEKRTILRTSFTTFTQTMLDVLWFSKTPKKRIPQFVAVEEGPLKDSFFENKPALCITAHMGSWEIMGQACALLGVDMASIAAPIKNPAINRLLIEQREHTGQTIIPRKGALKTLISRFRKNGKAAFVLDQNTPEKRGGIVVNFLGLPMPVSSAPAALAYRTGTEIMIGFCLPEAGGRYRIRITKSIPPPPFDKQADADKIIHQLTQQILNEISEEIRNHPQFWLWSYKHWRRNKGQTYPENYPHY